MSQFRPIEAIRDFLFNGDTNKTSTFMASADGNNNFKKVLDERIAAAYGGATGPAPNLSDVSVHVAAKNETA